MYIRFESPARDPDSRVNLGIFHTTGLCLDQTVSVDRSWHHAELRRELNWFNDRLNVPGDLYYRPGRRAGRSGICWFRDDATDHVNRARYMAWLLDELGYPISVRHSEMPGAILWQDAHQVVALPASRGLCHKAHLH